MENFRIGAGSLLAILLIAPLALSIPKGVRAARSTMSNLNRFYATAS